MRIGMARMYLLPMRLRRHSLCFVPRNDNMRCRISFFTCHGERSVTISFRENFGLAASSVGLIPGRKYANLDI